MDQKIVILDTADILFSSMTANDETEQIEKGFSLLVERIEDLKEKKEALKKKILEQDALLLQKMGASAVPVVKSIGINMMEKGKLDQKGEVYDAQFSKQKMIVLGKVEPDSYRPDDVNKKVQDQFCLLAEDGKFYEIMYSSDGFVIDSFLNPLQPKDVLDIYGNEVLFMLYRAMKDYLQEERDFVEALEKVFAYIVEK